MTERVRPVDFTILKIPGSDAVRLLYEHRSRYAVTGLYPFLIGDAEDLQYVAENAQFIKEESASIIRASFEVAPASWVTARRKEMQEYDIDPDSWFGAWPGEIGDKGAIGLHKDVVTGEIMPEIYLGLANIEKPWQLPAVAKFGAWNACPPPQVHCAYHRDWQEKYGAEITGMSRDIVECAVTKPPTDREAATVLAWEQFWYCADIVEQGVGSISHLAAALLNSPYWYFWWD